MILEGIAFEKVPLDNDVQGAAGLEQFPISYRSGHSLRSFLEKLPENRRFLFRIEADGLVRAKIDFQPLIREIVPTELE